MDWTHLLMPLGRELLELAALAVWFFALAWVVKRERAVSDGRAAASETRINLALWAVDALVVSPIVVAIATAGSLGLAKIGLVAPSEPLWRWLGPVPTGLLAIFVADFFGYWRHRLQHTALLWPAHAVHHSDTRLTWFSLNRMHPVDRLGTCLDLLLLTALGLPIWAVAVAVLVRHYYGYLIHADLPWTLGKAAWVFNSPVMHRWHHARDVEGSGANFATVFSVFDRAFGTLYAPGLCDQPLGVREDMGEGVLGQYLHPFRTWWSQIRSRSQATSGASAGGIG
jgi:sterol desaturase/sphingolipid hydroxylase (fatty acid hydroxylase superfamily)